MYKTTGHTAIDIVKDINRSVCYWLHYTHNAISTI